MRSSLLRRAQAPSTGDSLTTYLQDISAYPLLKRADEIALAQRSRAGDLEALDGLVCANLRFVVAMAKRYQNRGVALPDLIDEGNLGLIRAAERFDDAKGVRFISYAVWWIRQAILQAIAEQAHAVRVPLSRAGKVNRIGRHTGALRQELGREPTQQEVAAEMDISEVELVRSLPISRSYLSLDAPLAARENANLLDYLPDENGPTPDEKVIDGGLTESVYRALARLRDREALVLRLHFGLDGAEPMTLETIGALLGITRERVRQIKEKALVRLRRSDQATALASFCGR